ncbi:MAG: hypothetical protein ACE5GZ_10435 [Gammaproteobacteria bacterium]
MASSSDGYKRCLQDKALSIIDDNSDPRHVADAAMKQCARILENLNVELEKRDFPPGFRTRYIRRITHRSVTQLLTNLMVLMSARQQK